MLKASQRRKRCGAMRLLVPGLVTGALLIAGTAQATDGYFAHGYGMKAKGRAGVSMAYTDDAFGGANNPATMVWVGNRFEIGLTVLRPIRGAKRQGSAGGVVDFNETSDHNYFFVPELGYSHQINDRMAWGVDVYANGGLNTKYHDNTLTAADCHIPGTPAPANPNANRNSLCGQGRLGLNLNQVIIAPTFAYKLTPKMSVGIALLGGIQTLKMYGLQFFANPMLSNSPNNVSNKGTNWSYGYGARVGYFYRPFSWLSVGGAFSTRIRMSPFDRYRGVLANGGKFDVPRNYGVGFVLRPIRAVSVGFDFKRIEYGNVPSNGNGTDVPKKLGSHNGPGQQWQNVNAYKLGVELWPEGKSMPLGGRLTLRAGWDHADEVVSKQAVTVNILAPGVAQDHVTVGFTYRFGEHSEISGMYLHWLGETLTGPSALPFGGRETLSVHENAVGFAYARHF